MSDDAGKVLKGTVLDKADAAVPQRISDEEIALASVRRSRAVGHCRILRVVASQLQKKYRAHEFTTDHTADISCCRPVYDGGPEVEEDAWSAVIERVGSHERTGVTVISTTGHVEIREGNKTHELCALI